MLISQHEVLVEHCIRQPDGRWLIQPVLRAGDLLRLSALSIVIPVSHLYKRLFPLPQ